MSWMSTTWTDEVTISGERNHRFKKSGRDHPVDQEEMPQGDGEGGVLKGGVSFNPSKLPPYIVDPLHNRCFFFWELAVIFFTLYNTTAQFVVTAFSVEPTTSFLVLDTMGDVIFLLDIILTFFIAQIVTVRGEERLIIYQSLIAKRYLSSMFVIDVLAVGIPFVNVHGAPPYIDLLNLFKIMRLTKIGRVFKRRVKIPHGLVQAVSVMQLVTMVFFAAHFIGCIWWMLGTELSPDGKPHGTWVARKEGLKDATVYEKYMTSFYFAVTTLTTVGYGDISASNAFEMTFLSIILVFGAIMYGIIMGSVSSLIMEIRSSGNGLRRQLNSLETFVVNSQMPVELARKLREAVKYQWALFKDFDSNGGIVTKLPLHLQHEVAMQLHGEYILRVPLFRQLDTALIRSLVPRLMLQLCSADCVIFRQGDIGNEMYLIRRGQFALRTARSDKPLAIMEKDSHMGVLSLLKSNMHRMASCWALTRGEFYILERRAFLDVLEYYPRMENIIQEAAMQELHTELNFIRKFQKTDLRPANAWLAEGSYLIVEVDEAQNLLRKDLGGLSDPYVRILIGPQQIYKSAVVPQNLSPKWGETFVHHIHGDVFGQELEELFLYFDVYDYDDFNFTDDFIGRCKIRVVDLLEGKKISGWFTLEEEDSGEAAISSEPRKHDSFLGRPRKTVTARSSIAQTAAGRRATSCVYGGAGPPKIRRPSARRRTKTHRVSTAHRGGSSSRVAPHMGGTIAPGEKTVSTKGGCSRALCWRRTPGADSAASMISRPENAGEIFLTVQLHGSSDRTDIVSRNADILEDFNRLLLHPQSSRRFTSLSDAKKEAAKVGPKVRPASDFGNSLNLRYSKHGASVVGGEKETDTYGDAIEIDKDGTLSYLFKGDAGDTDDCDSCGDGGTDGGREGGAEMKRLEGKQETPSSRLDAGAKTQVDRLKEGVLSSSGSRTGLRSMTPGFSSFRESDGVIDLMLTRCMSMQHTSTAQNHSSTGWRPSTKLADMITKLSKQIDELRDEVRGRK